MRPVKIFTDSTADLSPALLDRYQIGCVPLYVSFGNESYRDGLDLTVDEMYKRVEKESALPRTAAPTPADYAGAFRPWVEKGFDVVYIGLSSFFSAALQSAKIAAAELGADQVTVIDSLNLSTGIGLLVLKAAELAKEGLSASAIRERIEVLVPRVRSSFVIDTLDYLHMGGRCSSVSLLLGSILKVHPLIVVENGKMSVGEKYHGSRKQILKKIMQRVLDRKGTIDPGRIFVTGSACPEDCEAVANALREHFPGTEVLTTAAGCVISSHCGPKTIGILYIEKA